MMMIVIIIKIITAQNIEIHSLIFCWFQAQLVI